MATVTPPPEAEDRIDESVRHPLARLRSTIRWYVALEGLALVGLFLALYFWIGLLADYGFFRASGVDWVQDAPWAMRAIVLGLVVVALLALVALRLFVRLFREFSNRSLALVLERRFPKILGDRLITAVDLADLDKAERYGYSRAMVRQTIDQARDRVDRVPLSHVFDWGRLRGQGIWLAVVTLGFAAMVFLAGLMWVALGQKPLGTFAKQSQDVAVIWAERNLLLRDVPWPRDTYLEVVDFTDHELRVGRDDASPRVVVRAWKWVIADESTPDGWRPLVYDDLAGVLGDEPPELPIRNLRGVGRDLALIGSFAGASGNPLAMAVGLQVTPEAIGLRLPRDVPVTDDELGDWRVDRIEQVLIDSPQISQYLERAGEAKAVAALKEMFDRLAAEATDPGNSRYVRLLDPPTEVKLAYWNAKADNEMTLKGSDLEYSGVLSDLKESIKLRASAGDYTTATHQVTLVPPPQLERLTRTEWRPAYLYHRPPTDGDASSLRGLRQVFPDLAVSLTGSNSLFEIPAGTELTMTGTADKDLTSAALIPTPGAFPGYPEGQEATPIGLALADDHRTFSFSFTGENFITVATEFDISLTDTDGVESRRLIQIRPVPDLPPEVEVDVEVIRKVGNVYYCTPIALIPFVKESRVTDREGLGDISYRFEYRKMESRDQVGVRASVVGGIMLRSPVVPTVGDLIFPAAYTAEFGGLMSSGDPTVRRAETIAGFEKLWRERAEGDVELARLKEQLESPIDEGRRPIIKQFSFESEIPDVELDRGGFDLRARMPELFETDDAKPQQRYRVRLDVVATDINAEVRPRVSEALAPFSAVAGAALGLEWPTGQTGVNAEPIILEVMSEEDLLSAISEEEEKLVLKLDKVVSVLEESDRKLTRLTDILPTLEPPGDDAADAEKNQYLLSESTRSAEIVEELDNAFNETEKLATAYERILNEYRYNRCKQKLVEKYEEQVAKPLEIAVKVQFPALREAMAEFNGALQSDDRQRPTEEVSQKCVQLLRDLLASLMRVQEGIGEITTIKSLIDQARVIVKTQDSIDAQIEQWRIDEEKAVFAPKIVNVPAPVVNAGETAKLQLGVDFGLAFDDPILELTFAAPGNSGLKLPDRIRLKTAEAELAGPTPVEFEITAGDKKGQFAVTITPAPEGRAVTMIVTVK